MHLSTYAIFAQSEKYVGHYSAHFWHFLKMAAQKNEPPVHALGPTLCKSVFAGDSSTSHCQRLEGQTLVLPDS